MLESSKPDVNPVKQLVVLKTSKSDVNLNVMTKGQQTLVRPGDKSSERNVVVATLVSGVLGTPMELLGKFHGLCLSKAAQVETVLCVVTMKPTLIRMTY